MIINFSIKKLIKYTYNVTLKWSFKCYIYMSL